MFNATEHEIAKTNKTIMLKEKYSHIYEQDKFHVQMSWACKMF